MSNTEKLDLRNNHFYFVLLGALYTRLDNQKAIALSGKAATATKTASEKQIMLKKRDTAGRRG